MIAELEIHRKAPVFAELKHITKTFRTSRGPLIACDDVSLTIRKGVSLGLVGESGSGKSTLIRVLQMLIPPTSGEVILDGVNVSRLPERKIKPFRRKIQFVAQDPYGSLFPNLTVAQNIMEPLIIHSIGNRSTREEQVIKLMERVGLPMTYYNAFAHELSGGQQQRVAIARALALLPELIVLDEAVSSLDVSIQAQILNLLQSLKDEYNLTYVFISHNLAVIRLLCEETAVMYMGRIVELGDSEKLFARPLHPYTQSLISVIPAFHADGVTPLPSSSLFANGERPSPTHLPKGCAFHPRCPFATDRCRVERPELRQIQPGRQVACHYAESVV
jgi:oligopeptide/dipeptide ABC transporter ATP-binding protein